MRPGSLFCRERHRVPGLEFVAGDAEKLPFAAGSFDVVINVEASHCYPAFPRFLAEVARVLRPGEHFAYADFRFAERLPEWDAALASASLEKVRSRIINAEVLRGMRLNSRTVAGPGRTAFAEGVAVPGPGFCGHQGIAGLSGAGGGRNGIPLLLFSQGMTACEDATAHLVPEGQTIIAQCFNIGHPPRKNSSPEGTAEPHACNRN